MRASEKTELEVSVLPPLWKYLSEVTCYVILSTLEHSALQFLL